MKLLKKIWFYAVVLPIMALHVFIIKSLLRMKKRLQVSSLRQAIHGADEDKQQTGRKNMVVPNSASGQYEAYQKKLLKQVARTGRNTSNKAMTPGRVKMLKPKRRIMDFDRVKQIENRSLYVTK